MSSRQLQSCPNCGLSNDSSGHVISFQAKTIQELKQEVTGMIQHLPTTRTLTSLHQTTRSSIEKRRSGRRNNDNNAWMHPPRHRTDNQEERMDTLVSHRASIQLLAQNFTQWTNASAAIRPDFLLHHLKREHSWMFPDPLAYGVREHVINIYSFSRRVAEELIPESARIELPSSSVVVTK